MIDGLKPYPTYKDSGVPWLGRVPGHWEVSRLKRAAKLNPVRSEVSSAFSDDEPVTFLPMELVGADGRVDVRDSRPLSAVRNGFTYFRRSDVIVAKITPCFENGKGACLDALPTEVGFGSTEFHVLRALELILPRFLYRVTTLPDFRRLGAEAMKGAAGQQRVPQSFVGDFQVALPPLPEQSAIVRFLDHADRGIRRYVRAKRKLIELLNEQKQTVIQRTVTCGLDHNVRLKPSGLGWLGDIPEHWEVKRAKWYYREVDERSNSGEEELLSVSHITGVTPRSEKNVTMFMAESYVGHKLCRPGDLVINTMWAWMAAIGVARQTGLVSPSYAVYRPVAEGAFLPEFVDFLLRTRPYVSEYICRSTGIRSSRLRLYAEQFLRIPLVRPPLSEQQSILEAVSRNTAELQAAIEAARREIVLVHEYRTRLIADVVTGKLDVREAAANLPEEANEAEPIDDSSALTETAEPTEETELAEATEDAEA